jgi:hypothetical protein
MTSSFVSPKHKQTWLRPACPCHRELGRGVADHVHAISARKETSVASVEQATTGSGATAGHQLRQERIRCVESD